MTRKKKHSVKVYTAGVFDILHPGHLNILQRAKACGDYLVVGIQEDQSVLKQKGQYPAMTHKERSAVISALPFVDEVVTYNNTDQRRLLKKIKPNIVVQGDDWDKGFDRTIIKTYLKENNIELKLVPYTQTVSSTIIKNRFLQHVLPYRNDTGLLKENLRLIEISDLKQYEKYDPKRSVRLVTKIKNQNLFLDPVSVGRIGKQLILIDGANRVEALTRLGAYRVLANIIEYASPLSVELTHNIHYLKISIPELLTLFRERDILYKKVTAKNAAQSLLQQKIVAVIQSGKTCYQIGITGDLNETVCQINNIVDSYIHNKNIAVFRASELSRDNLSMPTKISFRKFTKKEIESMVENNMLLESGVTWHKLKNSIIRVGIPLALLMKKMSTNTAEKELRTFVDMKIAQGRIRYYPSNVYICDEWE